MQDRLPPHDILAEEAVIGSILIDPEAFPKVRDVLRPEHFYRERHALIFDSMRSLWDGRVGIDQVTVGHELEVRGRIEDAGGLGYLSHLVGVTPTSTYALHYAGIVKRCAMSRKLIDVARDIAGIGYDNQGDASAAVADAMAKVLGVEREASDRRARLTSIRQVADENLQRLIEEGETRGFGMTGLMTHIADLDRVLGGLKPGMLYVLGAATSMGKTQMMLTLCYRLAMHGHQACYLSLEQTSETALIRLVEMKLGWRLRDLKTEEDRERRMSEILDAYGSVADMPIVLTTDGDMTSDTVRSRVIEHMARGEKPALVCVDYAQLLRDQGGRDESRAQTLGRAVRNLKALALEAQVPVVLGSQLSRDSEHRTGRRPQLTDLRDSGEIEQHADVVALLYRHSYYVERGALQPDPALQHVLEVNVAKHRDGPTDNVKLFFDPAKGRIENLARPAPRPKAPAAQQPLIKDGEKAMH